MESNTYGDYATLHAGKYSTAPDVLVVPTLIDEMLV